MKRRARPRRTRRQKVRQQERRERQLTRDAALTLLAGDDTQRWVRLLLATVHFWRRAVFLRAARDGRLRVITAPFLRRVIFEAPGLVMELSKAELESHA